MSKNEPALNARSRTSFWHHTFPPFILFFKTFTAELFPLDYFHKRVYSEGWGKAPYPLSVLWLHWVLMHWGSASCRLGSMAVNVIGSWCTSQLGFLHWSKERPCAVRKPLRAQSKSSLLIPCCLLHHTRTPACWRSAGQRGKLFLQSHLLSALVKFPVHSFTSSGHSQGHSHSFCSILQGRKHGENPSDTTGILTPRWCSSGAAVLMEKAVEGFCSFPQEQGLLCPAPGLRVTHPWNSKSRQSLRLGCEDPFWQCHKHLRMVWAKPPGSPQLKTSNPCKIIGISLPEERGSLTGNCS